MNSASNILSIPSLPIIQSSVISMSPLFNGKRHDGYINALLAFIRGEKSREEMDEFLLSNNLQVEQNADFALLTGEKRDEQVIACAAYIASSVLIEPNLAEFLEATGKIDEKTKSAEFKINQDRLRQSLSAKLAVALATTDIFALIANALESKPGITLEECRQEVKRLFTLLAQKFLDRVQQHFVAGMQYNLVQFQNGQFIFTCSNGYLFQFDQRGLTLKLTGIIWYGQGKLFGQMTRCQLAYFPEEINQLLQDA